MIPNEWRKYPIPSTVSANVWMIDFAQRLAQLTEIKKSKDFGRSSIWLGGLFFPEAYITATRQAAAQATNWSVENLELEMIILDANAKHEVDDTSFIIKGK
jgi:dynein heavy chain 1